MKKIVCFITVLIFSISILSPLSVFADVTIGDNNEEILSNEQLAIGQKIALLELFNDLITNGVNELSIDATGMSIDDYLDYLWSEIENAYNNPSDNLTIENFINVGTWDALASIHDRVIENGKKYGFGLNSVAGIYTLTDFFLNADFKGLYEYHPETLDAFRYLSENNNSSYIPELYQSWCSIISGYGVGSDNISIKEPFANPGQYYWNIIFPFSFVSYNLFNTESSSERNIAYYDVGTLYIDSTNDNRFHLTSQGLNPRAILHHGSIQWNQSNRTFYESNVDLWSAFGYQSNSTSYIEDSYYNDLTSCMIYILNKYRHINLIVDGNRWIDLTGVSNIPNLDIDGILELFGQNQPVQYYFPDDIEIDYKKLYQVIKDAIDNGTPVSMQTINNNQVYNDSHNTVYSPTIINNYNTNNGNESDFIDSVLDLATIPKFDEAYVRPINDPFTKGVGYAIIGAEVIPSDIKFIFGAIFVLLLFVLMINRFFE